MPLSVALSRHAQTRFSWPQLRWLSWPQLRWPHFYWPLPFRRFKPLQIAGVVALAACLGGCLGYDGEIQHGFQADASAMADVKPGASAEQVLVLLGTPSTTSTVGGDAWYYISQKTEHDLAFMPPKIVDQRIYAVYFDKTKKVTRIANYGLEDGKVVNFTSRSTPTSGTESTFLKNMMLNLMHFG